MSILQSVAGLLLAEHKIRPITGDLLTIGRQTVNFKYGYAVRLLAEAGLVPRLGHINRDDHDVPGSKRKGFISDVSFFSLFTDARVKSLDVSAYEGADIIHNMNEELPDHLYGVADFVFDGSCLDNIFDPARAVRCMSKLLRANGRIFLFNHSTLISSAYLAFSPEWFWDFFEANGYRAIKIFSGEFRSVSKTWDILPWVPGTAYPRGDFITVAIAEKARESSDDVAPIQAQYRRLHGTQ